MPGKIIIMSRGEPNVVAIYSVISFGNVGS